MEKNCFTLPADLNISKLIEWLGEVCSELPDLREKSNNRRYEVRDAALSAFAVFFTQSPSFLDYQVRMRKEQGKDNLSSLFGVYQIPSDNQIRNILDPVEPQRLYPAIQTIVDICHQGGYLDKFRSINKHLLVAFDGVNYFSSEKISCPNCSQASDKEGKTRYRHMAVTPVIVAPGHNEAVVLPPEFITPQDGHDKQDCEIAAAKRWLGQWGEHYTQWKVTYLGDDLYCHQPLCERILALSADFIFVCKKTSHATLYEWVADFDRNKQLGELEQQRCIGKKSFTDRYRFLNEIPLRNGDDALLINWCELSTTDANGKVIYSSAWATSHMITEQNVVDIAAAGRSRWKIENENNNTLKTKGYHFEHNFGHGKIHLSNILATMNLLAFQIHTVMGWVDQQYQSVRRALPSRKTFFEHVKALTQYLPFDGWAALWLFMLSKLVPNNTS